MSLSLYMDHHVHSGISKGLRRREIDVLTTNEDQTTRWADPDLLTRADELQRLFFTHDSDLLVEAARRQRKGEHFFGLVYAEELRITIGQAIEQLELICKIYNTADVENRVIHLPW